MAFCPMCGAQLAEGIVCTKCSVSAGTSPAAVVTVPAGLTDNVAGALAYVTIIPAIVFLVLEPFNRKRFVRFHAFQCLFFAVAWTVLWIGLSILGHIPFLGWATGFRVWSSEASGPRRRRRESSTTGVVGLPSFSQP